MTAADLQAAAIQVARELLGDTGFVCDFLLAAVVFEDLHELGQRRRLGEHLVLDPPEERLVHKVTWFQVGGEYRKDLERDMKFLTGLQRQEIDAAFQRHNRSEERRVGKG